MLGPIRKEVQSKPEDWPSYGHADAFRTYSSQACSVTQVFSVNLKRKGFERKTTQWAWSCVYRACPVRQEFHHTYPSVLCTGPTEPTASCSGFSVPPSPPPRVSELELGGEQGTSAGEATGSAF